MVKEILHFSYCGLLPYAIVQSAKRLVWGGGIEGQASWAAAQGSQTSINDFQQC
jgi:hypothetical protein